MTQSKEINEMRAHMADIFGANCFVQSQNTEKQNFTLSSSNLGRLVISIPPRPPKEKEIHRHFNPAWLETCFGQFDPGY